MSVRAYLRSGTYYVYVSCPYNETIVDENGKEMKCQEYIQMRARQHLHYCNAVVDGQVSGFAGTNNENWEPAWMASVWKVIENLPSPGRIVLVLVNGGGVGCVNERKTVPKLVEVIQKLLYPAGRMAEMVVDELPQVSYKIVNMADVVKHGVEKARCLKEGEGEGILGGKTGGGKYMEFDEDLQAYKTMALELIEHGVTDEDAAHLGRLLADDDKFTTVV